MSDALRQDNTDKAASALKPDSQKSTLEQVGDQAKSAGDSVAGTVQPSGDKSATQQASDSVSGSGSEGKGVLAQAQDAAGNAAKSVQDTLGLNQGATK